ncbi:MAG: carbon-nitrogen family hydrolase [Candidatus Methanofastidiosia archaeon]|jgi:predicted amidohydrolase
MNISLVQMELVDGAKEKNIEKALSCIALCRNADIVVLPELWSTGLALQKASELAEPVPGATTEILTEYCADNTMYIIGSILESCNNTYYNTLHVVGPHGLLGVYQKIHLFSLMEEDQFLTPGTEYNIFSTDVGTLAGIICYDIRFPELTRALTVKGAEILCVPAEFPCPRNKHWDILLQARAIENQIFVVACNRTGITSQYHFFGGSMVVDPWGDIVVKAGDKEGIYTCVIDTSQISECRQRLPVLKDIQLL